MRVPLPVILLILYWLLQPFLILVVSLAFILLVPQDWLYGPPTFDNFVDIVSTPGFWVSILVIDAVITAAQGVMLFPVRKPGLTGRGGRSVRLTLLTAGVGWCLLSMGLLFTLGSLASVSGLWDWVERRFAGVLPTQAPEAIVWAVLLATAAVCWVVPTVLLFAFTRPGQREHVMARVANYLLLGTLAEALLAIPVDAMVRRKSECYCAEGTFFSLMFLGAVGTLAVGPVAILPLFARRRRAWYRTHCNACGYDMVGVSNPRCPECGTPWRPPSPTPPVPRRVTPPPPPPPAG